MKIFRYALLCSVIMAGSYTASAMDVTPYIGLSAGSYNLKYSQSGPAGNMGMSGSTWGAEVKGGLQFGSFAGLELRLGRTGTVSTNIPVNTIGNAWPITMDLTTDLYISYLLKPQYEWKKRWKVYALLGGTAASMQTRAAGGTYLQTSTWKTGFTYGVGMEYMFRMNGSLILEFVQYWTDTQLGAASGTTSNASIRGINVSVNKYF